MRLGLCQCSSRAERRLDSRRGVVHRDLKPENFLLKAKHATVDHPCTQHNVRCIDFGSAAIVKPGARRALASCSMYHPWHAAGTTV